MYIDEKIANYKELIKALANATKTYYICGGHTKANMNEIAMNTYSTELLNRGIEIPDTNDLLAMGIFNGEGSF